MTEFWRALLFGLIIPVAACPVAGAKEGSSPANLELKVSHEARSLQPGEVVLMTVRSLVPIKRVTGKVFDKTFPFFSQDNGTAWKGLIGIDLNVTPDDYRVQLFVTGQDGINLQTGYDLAVKEKQFPTRRLTVKEAFVNPPAEEMKRIRQESRQVAAIFAGTSPDRLWEGTFVRPVPGAATSSFGKRSILNGQPRSPHSGADFRAGKGTPVYAPNAGKVLLAADLYFSGNVVILDHGLGLYSYFAHLSRSTVSEGDVLSRGDLIGYVGATGRVTGPHLHWSLRLSGARVDPLSLLAVLSGSR